MHALNHTHARSRKAGSPALLLLGGAALSFGLAHRACAQATVGGGSLVSPVTGTLVSPPTNALTNPLTGMPGPSYGIDGPNMVLVKNWDFGTDGTIPSYDAMSANFFYHDQIDNIFNGTYGAAAAAPDFQDSVNDTDLGGKQPIEGVDILNGTSFHQPALRSFLSDSLQTYLVPTYNAAPTDMISPYSHTALASGSFMAKWRLPAGGQLLGQDVVWETEVRYVTPPNFWFSLWANGSTELYTHGAEADLIESFGFNDTGIGGGTNYDGRLWHSNMVPSDTDQVDFGHGFAGNPASGSTPATGMAFANYGPSTSNPFDATQYHIWTWVYHADDSYQMFVDGREAQYGAHYPWTANAAPVVATPIDQRKQSGALSDLEFKFDNTWGNTAIPGQTDFSVAASAFPGTFYQYKYSRVYLSSGTINGTPVAEGAFTGSVTTPGTPPSVPCTIAASDYDTGGEGSGYHVYPDPNAGGSGYRADNPKHIYASSSPGGNGEVLGWNIANDWYKYTFTIPTTPHDSAAVLTASFEVNSYNLGGGTFHLEDENGNDLSGKMTVPSTNAPTPWVVITSPPFSLSAVSNPANGASNTHTLRLVMDTSGPGNFVTDFSWMHLDYATTLANSKFSTPAVYSSSAPTFDVKSDYIYNPTGNGWPMSAWTYSGNAGIAGATDDLIGIPANLPTGSTQCAFLQSPYGYITGFSGSTGSSTLSQTGGTLGNISQTLNLQAGTYTLTYNAGDWYADGMFIDTNGYLHTALPQVQVYLDPTFQQGIEQTGIAVGSPVTPASNSFSSAGSASTPDIYTVSFTVGTDAGSTVTSGVHTLALAELPFNTVQHGGNPYNGASTNLPGLATFLDNVSLAFTPPVVHTPVLLTGPVFSDGAGPWHGIAANAAPAAFDGKTNTFYDCANSSTGYVGIDAGTAQTVTKIVYAPRAGYEKRMVGGIFEGSSTSATAGYTTLATVTAVPKDGLVSSLSVTSTTAYRWLRYRGPAGSYGNVAEIQFLH